MHRHRRLLDDLRALFEGDTLFFYEGGGSGGESGGGEGGAGEGGAPGGEADPNAGALGGGGEEETLSKEDARKLRSEAKNLRDREKQAKDEAAKLKTELEELKSKDLSDQDKLRQDLDRRAQELEQEKSQRAELQERERKLIVRVAAVGAGIRPEATAAAVALVDWNEIDDVTDEKKVAKALKALKDDHAYLFASTSVEAGARGGGGSGEGDPTPGLGRLRDAYVTSSRN
jgi:hypothetical protein